MSRVDAPATHREWRFKPERTYRIPQSWIDNGRHEVPEDGEERFYGVQVRLGVSLQWSVNDAGQITDGPHRDKPTVRVCYVTQDARSARVRDWDALVEEGKAIPEPDFASILAIDPREAAPVTESTNRALYREVLRNRHEVDPVVTDGGTTTGESAQKRVPTSDGFTIDWEPKRESALCVFKPLRGMGQGSGSDDRPASREGGR